MWTLDYSHVGGPLEIPDAMHVYSNRCVVCRCMAPEQYIGALPQEGSVGRGRWTLNVQSCKKMFQSQPTSTSVSSVAFVYVCTYECMNV